MFGYLILQVCSLFQSLLQENLLKILENRLKTNKTEGIVLYCIVLMGWSLLSNALQSFWDLLCSPNLGIRTWICWFNFSQRPIFSGLRSFNKPEISDSRPPQLKVPPGGLVLRIFTSWKNPSPSARFEPVNLGSRGEHVTLRPPRLTIKSLTWIQETTLKRKVPNHG